MKDSYKVCGWDHNIQTTRPMRTLVDCQSEDQDPWTTRSASINKLADKDFFARDINKLRSSAAARARTPSFSPWEDLGQ